jgi:hypothetical protein
VALQVAQAQAQAEQQHFLQEMLILETSIKQAEDLAEQHLL